MEESTGSTEPNYSPPISILPKWPLSVWRSSSWGYGGGRPR